MRRVLLGLVLAACGPMATVATPSPPATAAPSAPSGLVTARPPSTPPPPTPAPPTPTPASSSLTPEPSVAPTPLPTPPPPTATPPPDLFAHNEKQWIVARPDVGIGFHTGEAPVAGTMVANYRLNRASLAGSTLRCTDLVQDVCNELRILPAAPLVNGRRYDLALFDQVIGSFTARGLVAATPHVLSASATQFELTVTYDRPMLHLGECGGTSWTLLQPGTLEFVRGASSTFPAPPGAYTSTDSGYRDFLTAFVGEGKLSDDCRAITLRSGWGAPTGSFELIVSGVEDEDGNVAPTRAFTIDVADEGPPKLMFAQLELQTAEKKVIRVAYSEAMDEEYVTDGERYYLNGKPIAPDTTLECELANCAWVRLTFAPTTFAYGADNTLTIVGVRDTAGNAMSPDIATSGTFQVR